MTLKRTSKIAVRQVRLSLLEKPGDLEKLRQGDVVLMEPGLMAFFGRKRVRGDEGRKTYRSSELIAQSSYDESQKRTEGYQGSKDAIISMSGTKIEIVYPEPGTFTRKVSFTEAIEPMREYRTGEEGYAERRKVIEKSIGWRK